MSIRLYCGLSERVWNHHPVAPGPYTCIAPVYGAHADRKRKNSVRVPADTSVIQDSGAFSDAIGDRLSFGDALERQLAHSDEYGYADQVTHVASYDLLIDEMWDDTGYRRKERWSEADAIDAVQETIEAARFLSQHRPDTDGVILSAQGVTPQQYLHCTRHVAEYLERDDIFGLGGWCIIGKMPAQMLPVFRETIRLVIPFIAKTDVAHVHIWGVMYAPALGELLWMCDQYNLRLSTDSVGPSYRPAFGQWGYADWIERGYEPPANKLLGLDRKRHVQEVRKWLADFRNTRYYYEPPPPVKQLYMFDDMEIA